MADPQDVAVETAKAAQEVAKFGTTVVEKVSGAAQAIASVFGSVPEDLVGRFGGDWLKVSRMENAANLVHSARARLAAKGVATFEPLSPSVGMPLLAAASDETRPEIRQLWERLLASAMNPSTAGAVRQSYIELVKRLDPLDALCFDEIYSKYPNQRVDVRMLKGLSTEGEDAITVSLYMLVELNLLTKQSNVEVGIGRFGDGFIQTVVGREFARALRS